MRVPVESLFDHLEAGVPLDEFLDEFPTVSRVQAIALVNAGLPHTNPIITRND